LYVTANWIVDVANGSFSSEPAGVASQLLRLYEGAAKVQKLIIGRDLRKPRN